jgi:hypothetical protein
MAATIGAFLAKNETRRRELEARPLRNFGDNAERKIAMEYITQCNLLSAVCMVYIRENNAMNIAYVETQYKAAYELAEAVTKIWPDAIQELKKLQKFIIKCHDEDHETTLRQVAASNPMFIIERFIAAVVHSVRCNKPVFQINAQTCKRNAVGLAEIAARYGLQVDTSTGHLEIWLDFNTNNYAETANVQFAQTIQTLKRNYRYYFFGVVSDGLIRADTVSIAVCERMQSRLQPLVAVLLRAGLTVTCSPEKIEITV